MKSILSYYLFDYKNNLYVNVYAEQTKRVHLHSKFHTILLLSSHTDHSISTTLFCTAVLYFITTQNSEENRQINSASNSNKSSITSCTRALQDRRWAQGAWT